MSEGSDDIPMQSLHTHPTDTARSRPEDQPFHVRILQSTRRPSPTLRLALGFLTLGATNNALYVVILTAALELIPKGVPTGVVAFANIAPALVAKAVWPYVLKGKVRYAQRVWSCVALSLLGIMVIAFLPALWTRLMGIALASFSSGLGELTFLQLSTRYGRAGSGKGVGWFSSGTGAAGLVGALAWWIVRPLGVKGGLCTLSFLPLLMGLAYGLILPSVEALEADLGIGKGGYAQVRAEEFDVRDGEEDEEEEEEEARLPGHGHGIDEDEAILAVSPHASLFEGVDGDTSTKEIKLSLQDKIQLIKPMLLVYILPLVLVYFFEYTINQGVAPTLLYPLPTPSTHPLLSLIIKQLKDYYPLYQLTYQTFVFFSRSSISIFRLPAIPKQYLWIPAVLQGALLALLISESWYTWFRDSIASPLVIVFVCVEGLAGGAAYVSVFYQIGTEESTGRGADGSHETDEASINTRKAQEHEFRIGCVGVGDTMGILLAAMISIPLELTLCNAQVRRGRTLCKEV